MHSAGQQIAMSRGMNTLFLVQIPHTAGTSLRLAACRHWGSGRIVRDHGAASRHTTSIVKELVYLEKDYHQFKEFLDADDIALLTTTLPLNGLRRIFPASNIITFVSDPITRLLKAYHKDVSEDFDETSFVEYCERSENQNVQHRYIKALPLELIGFVGISEHYSQSLEIINSQFECQLTELAKPGTESHSKNRKKPTPIREELRQTKLSKSANDRIKELNSLDLSLYKSASELFQIRSRLAEQQIDFTHGKVNQLTPDKISGWAVSTQAHTPCKIRIVVNKECVAVASAQEYLGNLKERNVSRDGYVGFSCRFPKKLGPRDVVSCYVHPSDQLLGGPQRID